MWETQKTEVLKAAQQMCQEGFVVGTSGNVSLRFRDPEGQEAVVAYYESLPDCTDLQMEEMRTQPGEPLPRAKMVEELCKLSTFPHSEQIQVYNDVMQMVIDATPGEYNVTQSLLKGRDQIQGTFTRKWELRNSRYLMDVSLLVPLGLLFLVLILAVRSTEALGQWWGIPLIGGSLITLLVSLLAGPLWRGIISGNMPEGIPQTSLLYHEIIDSTALIISPVFNPLVWQSFVILLIGAGLFTMSFTWTTFLGNFIPIIIFTSLFSLYNSHCIDNCNAPAVTAVPFNGVFPYESISTKNLDSIICHFHCHLPGI